MNIVDLLKKGYSLSDIQDMFNQECKEAEEQIKKETASNSANETLAKALVMWGIDKGAIAIDETFDMEPSIAKLAETIDNAKLTLSAIIGASGIPITKEYDALAYVLKMFNTL